MREKQICPRCGRIVPDNEFIWLDITGDESVLLERLPAATRFGCQVDAPPWPARARRRAAIEQILSEVQPRVPSCREMARLLGQHHIKVSHMQVARDYQEILPPRRRRGEEL